MTQARLVELARVLGVVVPTAGRKDAQIARLIESAKLPLPVWLGYLVRDELRAAFRDHGIETSSRSRTELAGALLDAAGLPRSRDTIPPMFAATGPRDVPKRGVVLAATTGPTSRSRHTVQPTRPSARRSRCSRIS